MQRAAAVESLAVEAGDTAVTAAIIVVWELHAGV
jgi:hypothetical protein